MDNVQTQCEWSSESQVPWPLHNLEQVRLAGKRPRQLATLTDETFAARHGPFLSSDGRVTLGSSTIVAITPLTKSSTASTAIRRKMRRLFFCNRFRSSGSLTRCMFSCGAAASKGHCFGAQPLPAETAQHLALC